MLTKVMENAAKKKGINFALANKGVRLIDIIFKENRPKIISSQIKQKYLEERFSFIKVFVYRHKRWRTLYGKLFWIFA